MDVDGDLRYAEPCESQKHDGVIRVIREHDCDPVAGMDTESRQTVRETIDPIVKAGERDAGAVAEAEGLRRVVAGAALQQLRDRIHGRYGNISVRRSACTRASSGSARTTSSSSPSIGRACSMRSTGR